MITSTRLKIDKWIIILSQFSDGMTMTDIQHQNIATWSCLTETIKELKKMKLITVSQSGRKKYLRLTKEGRKLREITQQIRHYIG